MPDDTERTIVETKGLPPPLGAYNHVLTARPGKLVFVAGQVSVDENGEVVGRGDLAAQTRQTYHNLEQALASAGAGFSDVVKFNTFIKKGEALQNYMDARREVFSSIYPDADYPAHTLLVIEALVREELLIEVEAVAALP